jgi:hypothetical protein
VCDGRPDRVDDVRIHPARRRWRLRGRAAR